MPLWGIDISHWQQGINLHQVRREGFDYVIARVGQGAGNRLNGGTYGTTRDREWARHRDQARAAGLILVAYWYIGDRISADDNARLCAEWMGDTSIPVALDCEDGSGTIGHYRAVLDAFRRRGLHVPLSYIPRWYWSHPRIGSPSLAGLPPLWSSRYVSGTGYASVLYPGDGAVQWQGYGGNHVVVSQFTNQARVAGMSVDANAFKGSRDQFAALINRSGGGGAAGGGDDMFSDEDRATLDLIRRVVAVRYPRGAINGKMIGNEWHGDTGEYVRVLRREIAALREGQAKMLELLAQQAAVSAEDIAAALRAGLAADLGPVLQDVIGDELADTVLDRLATRLQDGSPA